MVFGMLYVNLNLNKHEKILTPQGDIYFKAHVIEAPEAKEKSIKTLLRIIETNANENHLIGCKVNAYIKKSEKSFKAGDLLLIHSTLKTDRKT
ncbi:MAG: hypothetical protein HC906_16945 [Bacteroidales bacterium]|nr:hypothetical protein [Bacteroidales bacterium]